MTTHRTPFMNKSIYILGAGSIGCLWSAYLIKAGQSVNSIIRPERLANSSNPIALTLSESNVDGRPRKQSLELPLSSVDTIEQPIEQLIIATKAKMH